MTTYTTEKINHFAAITESEMKERERRVRKAKRLKQMRNRVRRETLFVVAVIMIIGCIFGHFTKNWECYNSVARKQLQMDVNKGDEDAIKFYRDNYIHRDIYLFDGPMTIELMANRHSMDADYLQTAFDESGYEHIQDWYDEVLKDVL